MTENEIRRVVEEAVRETLRAMGLDVDEPFENQKDAAFVRALELLAGRI